MSQLDFDPALRALALLRDEPLPSQWDRALERRLLAHYPRKRSRMRRNLSLGLVVLAFASAACAMGPWRELWRWWYTLEIDGTELRGEVVEGKAEVLRLSPTGDSVELRLAHERSSAGGERSQWDVAWKSPTHEEEQSIVEQSGAEPETEVALSRVVGKLPLHAWLDESGSEWALFLLREPEQAEESSAALYLLEPQGTALQVAGRGPEWLFDAQTCFEFGELPPQALSLGATHPSGETWRLALASASTAPGVLRELSSPDGHYHLRIGRVPAGAAAH